MQYLDIKDMLSRIPGMSAPLEKATSDRSIITFADLVNTSTQQFASSRKPEKHTNDLYRVVQGFDEKIRNFITRFNKEKVTIRGCDVPTTVEAFRQGLHQDSDMYKELTRHPCRTFEDVQAKATIVMRLEEDVLARRSLPSMERTSKKSALEKEERTKPYSRIVNKVKDREDTQSFPRLSEYGFTTGMEGLLRALRELGDKVKWPRLPTEGQAWGKITKRNVSSTVTLGLKQKTATPYKRRSNASGSDLSGLTYSTAKRHATKVKGNRTQASCLVTHSNLPTVTFDEVDIHDSDEHHDALIIMLFMANCTVKTVLVDTGSSANLAMLETIRNMGFSEKDLQKKIIPLVGFSGETTHSHEKIDACRFRSQN
ncbi:uncharacterized protein LOC141640731 [Silene latifolia]|uniref:uncharacterized protein LOC141640731 n=1 Tax=Silene latifolia TaxID=37657 RepID=UPI003D78A805